MTVDNFFRHKLLVAHRSINRLGASAASDVEPILSPVQIDHSQLLIDGLIDLSPFCFVLKQLLFNSCEYKHMEKRLFCSNIICNCFCIIYVMNKLISMKFLFYRMKIE